MRAASPRDAPQSKPRRESHQARDVSLSSSPFLFLFPSSLCSLFLKESPHSLCNTIRIFFVSLLLNCTYILGVVNGTHPILRSSLSFSVSLVTFTEQITREFERNFEPCANHFFNRVAVPGSEMK